MRAATVLPVLVVVAGCAVTAVSGLVGGGEPPAGPVANPIPGLTGPHSTEPGLRIAPERSMDGYDRDAFPHWSPQGSGCDTREVVLRELAAPDTYVEGQACKPGAGTQWIDAYTDDTLTDPSDVDIDHVVPLAEAWRSGADAWTEQQRAAFANDLIRPQLLPTSASVNRSKGDQDPATWLPDDEFASCQYVEMWIAVKRHYGLSADHAEHAALARTLATCGAGDREAS